MGARYCPGGRVLVVARSDNGHGIVLDGGARPITTIEQIVEYEDDWSFSRDLPPRFLGFEVSIRTGADAEARILRDFDSWFGRTRAESREQTGLDAGLLALPPGRDV